MIYAVLTGDITGYSRFEGADRERLTLALKVALEGLAEHITGLYSFDLYRGDGFQSVLGTPGLALEAAIAVRAGVRAGFRTDRRRVAPDCRIAIGIGGIDGFPNKTVSESDGEAFRRSGPVLDALKGENRLVVRSPWPDLDEEVNTETALLDALIHRWSPQQAQAILAQLRGLTQQETGRQIGISQPAVTNRLKTAGGWAIESLCRRFRTLVEAKISP